MSARGGIPNARMPEREARERVRREGGLPPKAFADQQLEIAEWARRVGWLKNWKYRLPDGAPRLFENKFRNAGSG